MQRYNRPMPAQLWSFIAVAAVVVVMPGADMAVVARNTFSRGRSAGLRTVGGTMLGLTVHGTAAVLGLSALLATSSTAFEVVKIVGAAYLVGLGLRTLWSTRRRDTVATPAARPRLPGPGDPLLQGFLTNVLNPKMAVFFVSFVPQFVAGDAPATPQIVVLSLVFVAMGAAWLVTYVAALGSLSGVLARSRVRRWMDRTVGTLLVGVGVRLAFAHRT
jgi:threonine/homoserine/homoserine lactone efflux protein